MATFHLQTFGCQMNVRDSQWLAAALRQRGLEPAAADSADICLLNTCSVREKPERKVMDAIGRIRRANKNLKLAGVLGCVGQQLGEKLFQLAPELRLVGGGDCMAQAPDAIISLLRDPGLRIALLDLPHAYQEREITPEGCPGRSAFVSIMQGCDNFCSYCIVPFTRGRQKSRSVEAIMAECRRWLDAGAAEITLLGQNVNVFGEDKKDMGRGFAALLRQIAALPGVGRLRFVTPHPADMGSAVVECFADLPNLCPRLHLPLQAGADRTLAAMRRRHTRAEYLKLVADLRRARPDLALSTDIIVGFPGETGDDFGQTLSMLEECAFMSSFSFCYSDRPGTRASLMPDKIARDVQLARLAALQDLQEKLTERWLAARVGSQTRLMLETPSPRGGANCWQGRDPYGMCVNVEVPEGGAGMFVNVEIDGVKKHSLTGRIAQET